MTGTAHIIRGNALDLPLADNFWSRVDRSGDCWVWTASINGSGYGSVRHDGRSTFAHRVAYELTLGPIPHGHVIDHLCRVRACCRPDHLEAVTNGENLRRGYIRENNGNLAKTACPSGHPYDQANTYTDKSGRRHCRTCRRRRVNRRRVAKRMAAA